MRIGVVERAPLLERGDQVLVELRLREVDLHAQPAQLGEVVPATEVREDPAQLQEGLEVARIDLEGLLETEDRLLHAPALEPAERHRPVPHGPAFREVVRSLPLLVAQGWGSGSVAARSGRPARSNERPRSQCSEASPPSPASRAAS